MDAVQTRQWPELKKVHKGLGKGLDYREIDDKFGVGTSSACKKVNTAGADEILLGTVPKFVLTHQQKATIVVTFVGTLVAVPPPNVDNDDCQHQDLFDSTLRGGESPAQM